MLKGGSGRLGLGPVVHRQTDRYEWKSVLAMRYCELQEPHSLVLQFDVYVPVQGPQAAGLRALKVVATSLKVVTEKIVMR